MVFSYNAQWTKELENTVLHNLSSTTSNLLSHITTDLLIPSIIYFICKSSVCFFSVLLYHFLKFPVVIDHFQASFNLCSDNSHVCCTISVWCCCLFLLFVFFCVVCFFVCLVIFANLVCIVPGNYLFRFSEVKGECAFLPSFRVPEKLEVSWPIPGCAWLWHSRTAGGFCSGLPLSLVVMLNEWRKSYNNPNHGQALGLSFCPLALQSFRTRV